VGEISIVCHVLRVELCGSPQAAVKLERDIIWGIRVATRTGEASGPQVVQEPEVLVTPLFHRAAHAHTSLYETQACQYQMQFPG